MNPFREFNAWLAQGLIQITELEMSVRINQSGDGRSIAQINDAAVGIRKPIQGIGKRANGQDFFVIDDNGAIGDGGSITRADPT